MINSERDLTTSQKKQTTISYWSDYERKSIYPVERSEKYIILSWIHVSLSIIRLFGHRFIPRFSPIASIFILYDRSLLTILNQKFMKSDEK